MGHYAYYFSGNIQKGNYVTANVNHIATLPAEHDMSIYGEEI